MADITIRGEDFYGVPDVTFPKIGGGSATYYENGGGSPTLQTKSKSYTPSESQQSEDVKSDAGYDGLEKVIVTVAAIPSTYVGSGVSRQAAQTIHPSASDQTIASGKYLEGVQTVKGVTLTNLTAANIKSGVQVKVGDASDDDCVTIVTGTYTGAGIGTLLATSTLGTVNTSSTSAVNLSKSVTISGVNSYDALVVETSVNTVTNGRHSCTVAVIWLTASSDVATKNGATIASNKLNMKISSGGVTTTRQSTTAYGVFPNSCTISNGSATLAMYARYNSTQTGTINGIYTTRVYGLKLYDLIGG